MPEDSEFARPDAAVAGAQAMIRSDVRHRIGTRRMMEGAIAAVAPPLAMGFPSRAIPGADLDKLARLFNSTGSNRAPLAF